MELESSRAHPGGRRSDVSAAGARAAGGVLPSAVVAGVTDRADLERCARLWSRRGAVAELESTKTKTRSAVGRSDPRSDPRLTIALRRRADGRTSAYGEQNSRRQGGRGVRVQSPRPPSRARSRSTAPGGETRGRVRASSSVETRVEANWTTRGARTRVVGPQDADAAEEKVRRTACAFDHSRTLPPRTASRRPRAGASASRRRRRPRANATVVLLGRRGRVARLGPPPRYQAEIDRLRGEVKRGARTRTRGGGARGCRPRLATALAASPSATTRFTTRESAALEKNSGAAAAARSQRGGASMRGGRARASEATAAEAAAREDAREVRAECARRVAAADAARSLGGVVGDVSSGW